MTTPTPPQEATTQPLYSGYHVEALLMCVPNLLERAMVKDTICTIIDDYEAELASLRQQLDEREAWEPITVPEYTEVEFTYYVPEAGDEASVYYSASVTSDSISIEDSTYALLGDFEIVRRRTQAPKGFPEDGS